MLKRFRRVVRLAESPEDVHVVRQRLHLIRRVVRSFLRERLGLLLVTGAEMNLRELLLRNVLQRLEHLLGHFLLRRQGRIDLQLVDGVLRLLDAAGVGTQRLGHGGGQLVIGNLVLARFLLCFVRSVATLLALDSQDRFQNGNLLLAFLHVTLLEVRRAQHHQTPHLLVRNIRRLQIQRVPQRDGLIPKLIATEQADQARSSMSSAAGAALIRLDAVGRNLVGRAEISGKRVVFRMARQLDQILGEVDAFTHAAEVTQIPNQPLVVVSVIMNLIRQHAVAHQVRVIHPGRRLLLPRRVGKAIQPRIDVPRHVPHVGDARRALAAERGGIQSAPGLLLVPKMNPVMMHRMHRVHREHGVRQCIHGGVAGDAQPLALVLPNLPDEKRLGLDVFRKLFDELLQTAHERPVPLRVRRRRSNCRSGRRRVGGTLLGFLLRLLGGLLVLRVQLADRFDPKAFATAQAVGQLIGPLDEFPGALRVVHVRQRHAPVGHRAVRVQRCDLTERSFGLEIPEAVHLPDALKEKLLRQGNLRRDRKVNLRHPFHQISRLTRPLIERLAMQGMPRRRGVRVSLVLRMIRQRRCHQPDGSAEGEES